MLSGRIYRAAFAPLLLALVIAGFSLTASPGPLTTTLVPEAFEGARAFAELERLAARFPDRRPGSPGDRELAAYVARALAQPPVGGGNGFSVGTHQLRAQTIDGERTLTTVIAQHPGTTGEQPIAIVAHRDAAGRGAAAELSATAVLLELARVLAAGETQRTIVLLSTSGGSGGDAGARDFAAHAAAWAGGPLDAAIVLGDLAGERPREPLVASFSESPGAAAALLQRTVSQAIAQQAGLAPSAPGTLSRLAQLVFPLPAGEEGAFNAQGQPAVLVQVGGEQAPAPDEPVSAARLEGLGRAVLSAVYALDGGPEVSSEAGGPAEAGLPIRHMTIPGWALRLLVAALLLPPLLVALDALAALRRRRRATPSEPGALDRSLASWILWVCACGLPFLICALFAILLGRLGAIAAPYPPVAPEALPFDGSAAAAAVAAALVLVLAWLAWPALTRRLGLPLRPTSDAAGIAVVLVLAALAVVVWAADPLTALLLVPALHLWLLLAAPARPTGERLSPGAALALVALGLLPLGLLIAFYAHQLGLGPGAVAHTALLLLASGRIGIAGAVLWSLAGGCLAATLLVALAAPREIPSEHWGSDGGGTGEPELLKIRGTVSYAGPGSLGGTESALRR
jgi:hypothetical protein